jgi:DNA end-binding protein Ku
VPRAEVDPVYFSNPYYVYPDGPISVETFRVIGAAMAEAGEVGIGRVTLSRRERPVMVEPRGAGMVLITLRASEEVKAAAFEKSDAKIDPDMVAIAETIIKRRSGHFDPATFRDRYQEALRELIDAKMKGLPVKPKQIASPPPVLDLMAALKRSLAQETGTAKSKRKAADRQADQPVAADVRKEERDSEACASDGSAEPPPESLGVGIRHQGNPSASCLSKGVELVQFACVNRGKRGQGSPCLSRDHAASRTMKAPCNPPHGAFRYRARW